MNIIIQGSTGKPIYAQIKDQIKSQIISGKLQPGEQLPSVRHLAKELMISVITTKRAYDELEKEGFVVSIQGKGSYVSPQSSEMLREEHLRQIEEHLKAALDLAVMSGISLEEVIEILHILEEEVG